VGVLGANHATESGLRTQMTCPQLAQYDGTREPPNKGMKA